MSFSGKVKEELYAIIEKGRSGQIAELAAITALSSRLSHENGGLCLAFSSDLEILKKKYFTLLKRTINIDNCGIVLNADDTARLLAATKLSPKEDPAGALQVGGQILQTPVCKQAFLRGAYLCGGETNDPAKSYHFEIAVSDVAFAKRLIEQIAFFGIDAGLSIRKGKNVVYVKEGAQIVELLGQMGAHRCLIDFEETRILNETRGNVNRRVNCETANINKTVSASVRQIDCIRKIEETIGLSALPEGLREMAYLRLQYPDEPLADLGDHFDPPVGKSGVNHRLRRIVDIAEKL